MEEGGYDEMFDDAAFRTALRNSTPAGRPRGWPRSVSEMRGHTDYGQQGMPVDADSRYNQHTDRRSEQARAQQTQAPGSITGMRRYADYGQFGPGAPGGRRLAAPASARRQLDGRAWTWRDSSSG